MQHKEDFMTRKLLEAYRANKRLIERNEKKISDEQMKEIPVVRGKVKGSSHDFPYIEQNFSVEMDEPIEAEKSARRIKCWEAEITQAEKEIESVEDFISAISDIRDREVLELRYMDGEADAKVTDIAKLLGYTKGRISQIVKKYLKD